VHRTSAPSLDPTPAAAALAAALLKEQGVDGGWGAEPGRPSNTEATALAVIALTRARGVSVEPATASAAVGRGLQWIVARQQPAGWWRATDQVPTASWMGSVAVLALAITGADPVRARRGGEWLLMDAGVSVGWLYRLANWYQRLRRGADDVELDVEIKGWAWAAETFAWVEPTALAMLALQALAADVALGPSPERAARLHDGRRLLVDRMTPAGGWNYGNSRVLGEDLEPYPDTTAWGLLALAANPVPTAVERSLAALDRLMAENASPLARSLAVLARRAHGRETRALGSLLEAQCGGPELPTDARTRALALLALTPGASLFAGDPSAQPS
jgi:hypothetical protein